MKKALVTLAAIVVMLGTVSATNRAVPPPGCGGCWEQCGMQGLSWEAGCIAGGGDEFECYVAGMMWTCSCSCVDCCTPIPGCNCDLQLQLTIEGEQSEVTMKEIRQMMRNGALKDENFRKQLRQLGQQLKQKRKDN